MPKLYLDFLEHNRKADKCPDDAKSGVTNVGDVKEKKKKRKLGTPTSSNQCKKKKKYTQ